MKFLLTKDLQHSSLLSKLMLGVCVTLFLYLGLDVVLHAYVLGADLTTLTNTLYGNEEEFIEPILLDVLLLQVHSDLFMSLFSIMIISSIYIRFYSANRSTKWLVHILFLLGLFTPAFLMLSYFTSVGFVMLWLGSFVLCHLLGMLMSLRISIRLLLK